MQISRIFAHGIVPVFLVLFAVYLLRDIPGALAPPLFHEDGPNMLDFYTDGHAPGRIFRFYGGYVSVGPNLLGYLIGFLPVPMAVYALYWVPMAIAAATFAALCHPGFDLPGITPRERIFVALLLGLFPASNMALTTNTTFSLWHLAILLFFMSLLWRPATARGAVLGAVFGVIAVASHPVSIILLPVLVWRVWRAETALERLTFLPVLIAVPLYVLLGVDPTGTGGGLDIPATLWEAVRLFLERGIFETLFGTPLRLMLLYRGLEPLIWLFGTALLALILWQVRGGVRLLVVVLLVLGFGNSCFSAVVRDMPLTVTWGHRYGYLTGVLFLLAAAISLLPAFRRFRPSSVWMRPALLAGLAGVALVSLVLKLPYYRNDPVKGAEVAQLVAAIEGRSPPYCVRVERGEWSFAVRKGNPTDCVTLPPITQ